MVHVFCIGCKIPLTNATKGTQDVQAPRCVLVEIVFIPKFCVAPDTFVLVLVLLYFKTRIVLQKIKYNLMFVPNPTSLIQGIGAKATRACLGSFP